MDINSILQKIKRDKRRKRTGKYHSIFAEVTRRNLLEAKQREHTKRGEHRFLQYAMHLPVPEFNVPYFRNHGGQVLRRRKQFRSPPIHYPPRIVPHYEDPPPQIAGPPQPPPPPQPEPRVPRVAEPHRQAPRAAAPPSPQRAAAAGRRQRGARGRLFQANRRRARQPGRLFANRRPPERKYKPNNKDFRKQRRDAAAARQKSARAAARKNTREYQVK